MTPSPATPKAAATARRNSPASRSTLDTCRATDKVP